MRSTASASARPAYDVMLYGNGTGLPYGWARPGEIEAMLDSLPADPASCPPASGGHPEDLVLVPRPDDYFFWKAWYERRSRDLEFPQPGMIHPALHEPEVTFYTGTHRPHWLWRGDVGFPLCVSYSELRKVKNLHRGRVKWVCDSRGFSELAQYGRWTISPEKYAADVARYDEEIGGLAWASPQDWMAEKEIIYGGKIGRVTCVGTGLSEEEHQRRTVGNFLTLVDLWPRYSSRPCPFIPVLQGSSPAAYLRCYQMYQDAGAGLGDDYPVAGVGSVCRRQSTREIIDIARALGELGLDLHYFGMKITGISRPQIHRDITSLSVHGGIQSMDSMSWSETARHEPRLPGCTHVKRTGEPSPCNNCARYATRWREKVIAAMTAAQESPARANVQDELFTQVPVSRPAGSPATTWAPTLPHRVPRHQAARQASRGTVRRP